MTTLSPSAAAYLATLAATDKPALVTMNPQQARDAYNSSYPADQPPLEPVATTFERWAGQIRLKCWRGTGTPQTGAPCALYIHGGGWLLDSLEYHEGICRAIANRASAIVCSPDYRLAPEHPFPDGLNDCASALRFLHENAVALGIACNRIAVAGDSAGGNLAAVLSLMTRDGDLPRIATQLLIYPNTDQRQSTASLNKFGAGFGLSALEMAWFRTHYLPAPDQWSEWKAAPLRAKTLMDVARAVVVLAGHDILHEEGALYADRLALESCATLRTWQGQIHGFLSLGRHMPEAADAITWLCDEWGRISDAT